MQTGRCCSQGRAGRNLELKIPQLEAPLDEIVVSPLESQRLPHDSFPHERIRQEVPERDIHGLLQYITRTIPLHGVSLLHTATIRMGLNPVAAGADDWTNLLTVVALLLEAQAAMLGLNLGLCRCADLHPVLNKIAAVSHHGLRMTGTRT